jgi:hypothetical protein
MGTTLGTYTWLLIWKIFAGKPVIPAAFNGNGYLLRLWRICDEALCISLGCN